MNNQGELVDLPAALFQFTTVLFVGIAAWAAVVGLLASWAPTTRIARALTPRIIRAAIFTTVSGTLAMSPAQADGKLDGLPYPDRGVTTGPVTPAPPPSVAATEPGRHIVKSGESLWSIAAASLPPNADARHVTRAANAWYEANRAAIGPNPDVILPGQDLAAPNVEVAR